MAAAQQRGWWALACFLCGAIAAAEFLEQPRRALAESPWLAGEALHEALSQKVTVVWSNIPVRQAVEGLSASQKVAILLDRRIDPDRKIELSLDDVVLAEGLRQIAAHLGGGATMIGPVAYFGPASSTGTVRAVAALRQQEAVKLPAAIRGRWSQPRPWKWDDLSAPRDLLNALAQEAGVTVEGQEQVPADRWAHADLPPLTLPERLTLLLGQFDLTYEPSSDGKSIRLVPLPDKALVDSGAPISASAPQPEKPGHRIVVGQARKVYSLQVELPVGQLLQSLGPRMGMEIRIDKDAVAAAGKSLETKVRIDVKDASADELLAAVLEPAGLTFTRKENVVEVRPK